MAPMTRWRSPGGVPGEDVASYYRRRAENEIGLILSEGTVVDRPAARNEPDIPFFHGTDALAGWKNVIDEVHRVGGKMGPQLWHVGAMPSEWTPWVPDAPSESPSGLMAARQSAGKATSEEDVADTIAAFGRAAAAARRLKFDVIEIHGAHGYLIDQFFWSETNMRDDAYGGASLRERVRFGADVIKAVRAGSGHAGYPAPQPVEAARLFGEACPHARSDGGMATPSGGGWGRCIALFSAPYLGAGISGNRWRTGPQFCGLGEEVDWSGHNQRWISRPVG